MSSSIAPSSGGGSATNFPQAGQLDWVALSNTTVSFSVNVLARLHNAGVAGITLCIGRALCSSIKLQPDAQQRLQDSLLKLQSCSAYGKILWFGFGVKHIIHSLSDTEQGAACLALCAALAVPYQSFFGAKVFREICLLTRVPGDLRPSLRQWSSLINICSGALTSSQFPALYDGFARLLAPGYQGQSPTDPAALARAIAILVDISSGKVNSVTFTGSIDCAWLAAVAQWLLSLNIEIIDSSGCCLYRSNFARSDATTQVTFVRDQENTTTATQAVLTRFIVPSGQRLIHKDEVGPAVRGPGSWSTILKDTFGPAAQKLLDSPTQVHLGLLIRYLCHNPTNTQIMFARPGFHDANPQTQKCSSWLAGTDRTPSECLALCSKLLPELTFCLDATRNLVQATDPTDRPCDLLQAIQKHCSCHSCRDLWGASTCLASLARSILRYLLILTPVVIDVNLRPSSTALKQLYLQEHSKRPEESSIILGHERLPLVLFLLSGESVADFDENDFSALSQNGVCVFYQLLEGLDGTPINLLTIQAVPGHIEHQGHLYRKLTDLQFTNGIQELSNWRTLPNLYLYWRLEKCKTEIVLEEAEGSEILTAAFKLQYTDHQRTTSHDLWINISQLRTFIEMSVFVAGEEDHLDSPEFILPRTRHSRKLSDAVWTFNFDATDQNCSLSRQWSNLKYSIVDLDHARIMDLEAFPFDCIGFYLMCLSHEFQQALTSDNSDRVLLAKTRACSKCLARTAFQPRVEGNQRDTDHSKITSGKGTVTVHAPDGSVRKSSFSLNLSHTKSRWSQAYGWAKVPFSRTPS